MKAVVHNKYGSADVVQLKEIEKPAPKENEVLVKVMAASMNAYDWHLLSADIFLIRVSGGGFFKPKNTRLGADLAGQVEAVGKIDAHIATLNKDLATAQGEASLRAACRPARQHRS